MTDHPIEPMALAAQIVSAHVSNNTVEANTLPSLIQEVYLALTGVKGGIGEPATSEKPVPAVPIKKSVYPDYIVCLEDGKKLKMLKRHLKSSFNMTVEQYRERWGLPYDYLMTAPSYSKRRSNMAKELGLGHRVEGPGELPRRRRSKAAE